MKVFAFLHSSVVLGVLTATIGLLAMAGCSGGWGEFKPTIAIQQGQSQAVTVGQTATFTVTAAGTGPFTYQWYANGVAISGATSSSYTTGATVSSQNGWVYTVAVTNAGGTVMSAPYVLTVNTTPAITVQPASQTVLIGQAASFTVVATGTAPLSYQWYQGGAAISGATSSSYTTPATTVIGNGPVYTVTVTNVAGTVTSATATLTVDPLMPTLTFATIASQTYGVSPFTVSATSASGGTVTYSVVSGPAMISGNTVTLTGVGTVELQANQAANGNYAAATTTTSFTVTAETPTLTFATIASQIYGVSPFTVSATSASGGTVTYSVVSGPATISGSTVTLTGVGTVKLQASQAANGNYAVATTTISFTVTAAMPTLTVASSSNPSTYGGSVTFTATISSGPTGTVTFYDGGTSIGTGAISGTTATFTTSTLAAGTHTITAGWAGNSDYNAVTSSAITQTVNPATPTLTFATIASQTYGVSPFTVSATSASGGTVTYSVVSGPATISGNTVTLTGVGTVELQANQAANGNYAAATTTTSFTVTANVSITPITPANQTMAPVQQAFSATASGGPTNTLTWSATGGSFIGNVWTPPDTAGTYTITATSVDNSSVYVTTTATVSIPVITIQPASKNVCVGYSPSFTIGANYATSYLWSEGGSTVGTGSTLTFNDVQTSNNGSYTCTVTNGAGSVVSNAATLNVLTPTTLTITSNPASVSVYATQTATFAVAASGTGTLSYQWYTGTPGSGTIISGVTSSTYTTGALTTANSGTGYYVTVTDKDCTDTTLTSTAATVTVTNTDTAVPPTIVIQPTGQTATVNGTATFSVTASGSGTLTYQWYRVAFSATQLSNPTAGVAITGATSSTYTVPDTETAQSNDGDNYYVIVQNAYGSAQSIQAPLAVGNGILLQITGQPQTTYVAANSLASFSVTATCTGCIPAYQWYWAAPGSTSFTALTNGAISSGTLNGATVSGATTSSLTLESAPTSASGSIFYVVVTSTSDGTTKISGTNPLTSSTAGLFVGSLGAIGNPTAGEGLCNYNSVNWVLNGTTNGTHTAGTSSGDVPYQNTSACTIEMTNNQGTEAASVYWPTLISTAKFTVSYTVAIAHTNGQTPADGFTMILANPSQGATTASMGRTGEGLGADGIPGFVLGFDTFQNGNANGGPLENTCPQYTGDTTNMACDPITVPYMAVGQGATSLWENPWTYVNGNLDTQNSTDYPIDTFTSATHTYVVTVVNSIMTVTMDGYELFTGTVSLPPVAYLGFTASTGGDEEEVTISALTAAVSAP